MLATGKEECRRRKQLVFIQQALLVKADGLGGIGKGRLMGVASGKAARQIGDNNAKGMLSVSRFYCDKKSSMPFTPWSAQKMVNRSPVGLVRYGQPYPRIYPQNQGML